MSNEPCCECQDEKQQGKLVVEYFSVSIFMMRYSAKLWLRRS